MTSPVRPPNRFQRAVMAQRDRRAQAGSDEGFTLVELLVAFACLIILITLAASALTTYLNAGTTVISSYSATDTLLPSSITIQRLIRSEVEPAPTPQLSTTTSSCAAINVPCPAFLTGSVGTYSTTFFANIGDTYGPAKIVMAESTPTQCGNCKFYSSVFTVTQYRACPALTVATSTCPVNNGCPFSYNSTYTCSWSTSGTVVVDVTNVVNGSVPLAGGPPYTSPLSQASTPIFTYNTIDPYSTNYVPGDGGTPASGTGILPGFNSCTAPNTDTNGNPTSANCPADDVQSVGVDLVVQVQGAPAHENAFTVYRLSSASYSYSPVVG